MGLDHSRETFPLLVDESAGQNHDKKIENRPFENVTRLKNLIQKEINRKLNSGNA
jgi:hypothetical protein